MWCNCNTWVGYGGGMAWDTEGTKRKLLEAATSEFAEHGPDGTTMARIGRRAGVNKERLYNYFGSKDDLFALVLGRELSRVAAAVPLDEVTSPQDVGAYAAAVHEYHESHPELSRLLVWEGLTSPTPVPDEEERTRYYGQKIDAFRRAQDAGIIDDAVPADTLAFAVIALALGWHTVPQMARMFHQDDDADSRAAVALAVERMVTPRGASGGEQAG